MISVRSSLFYGEQADARVNERHDILADCKSNQDIIGVPEDEANIIHTYQTLGRKTIVKH